MTESQPLDLADTLQWINSQIRLPAAITVGVAILFWIWSVAAQITGGKSQAEGISQAAQKLVPERLRALTRALILQTATIYLGMGIIHALDASAQTTPSGSPPSFVKFSTAGILVLVALSNALSVYAGDAASGPLIAVVLVAAIAAASYGVYLTGVVQHSMTAADLAKWIIPSGVFFAVGAAAVPSLTSPRQVARF